jgi:hypothetical protein
MYSEITNDQTVVLKYSVGRDSSVGIAIHYGMNDPGIESRCGEIFRAGVHPAFYKMCTGSFPGGKAAGAWRWPLNLI